MQLGACLPMPIAPYAPTHASGCKTCCPTLRTLRPRPRKNLRAMGWWRSLAQSRARRLPNPGQVSGFCLRLPPGSRCRHVSAIPFSSHMLKRARAREDIQRYTGHKTVEGGIPATHTWPLCNDLAGIHDRPVCTPCQNKVRGWTRANPRVNTIGSVHYGEMHNTWRVRV